MPLTAPPAAPPAAPVAPGPAPQRTDPATFSARADAFVAWLVGFRTSLDSLVTWLTSYISWASTNVTEMSALQSDVASKQSAAATSEANAAASAAAAAASADFFDDRYLGAKASDPVVDNDGNALLVGAEYFNTTTNQKKVWNGSGWGATIVASSSFMATVLDDTDAVTARSTLEAGPQSSAMVSLSGAQVDFTSIPSWVKRITVSIASASTTGTSVPCIQIGDSGGIETSGYVSSGALPIAGSATTGATATNCFLLTGAWSAASAMSGQAVLTRLDQTTKLWAFSSLVAHSGSSAVGVAGGSKSLSATLDRIRITTAGGVETFDAGTVSVLWE